MRSAAKDGKESSWDKARAASLEAIKGAEIDILAIPLVNKLNSKKDYFTTSSCSGRINILELDGFGAKFTADFLATWHGPCTSEGIKAALSKASRQVWLKVEPPIIHVSCRDLDAADALLKTAYSAGFKYSSIKSLKNGVLVEINSSEKMELPLFDEKLLVTDDYIAYLADIANKKMERSYAKLMKLTKAL